jgi:hypothetical protein
MTPLAFLCPLGLFLVGAAVAGLLALLAYLRGAKSRRPDVEPRKCRIAELRDGLCKVKGRLVARGEPLKSPLTNKPCVFYRFKAEQAYGTKTWRTIGGLAATWADAAEERADEHETWRPLVEDAQGTDLVLEDETGQALLDLRDAEFESILTVKEGVIDTRADVRFDLMLNKRYGQSTLLDGRQVARGYSNRWSSFARQGRELPRARVSEKVVENGVEVTVVGEVETREGKPPRFRPADFPVVVVPRGRKARLPVPGGSPKPLWIAAGIVMGATLLLTLIGSVIVCAGVMSNNKSSPPPAASPR